MNFDFSDDQKSLKDSARKFLTDKCSTAEVRKVLNNDDVAYHAELWAGVAEMGWLGAAIPEEFGGLGLGALELCVIAEEMGRAVAPVPFASTAYFFAEGVMVAGSKDQKEALLPAVAAGELIGALAISEGPGAATAASIKTTFNGSTVSGTKIPVTDGDIADKAIVVAREGSGISMVLVDLKAPGVTRTVLKTLDPTRSHAEITFDNAPGERLGEAGQGWNLVQRTLDRAAVYLAFEQLGGADRCLEMAKAWAMDRYAFGRPIAGYQAIKHKLADMYVKNEVGRSNAYYGAWALATDAPELPIAAAASRVAATEAFDFAAKENIQTHGGMGFTWEVDCHLYYRRAKLLGVQAGALKAWKERLVTQLENRNAA
jgi:alkylation response protein AidB-like acyl-CoA dehydrogenase